MTEATEILEVDDREIEITHADREIFPDDGFTKLDLAEYYRRIADHALPHFEDRALTLQRFPDGIDKEGFFQKAAPDYFPDWIKTVELKKEDGTITHVVANDPATLVYLANQGCITPHLSLFRIDDVEHPDRLIFDLDPSDRFFWKVRVTRDVWRRCNATKSPMTAFDPKRPMTRKSIDVRFPSIARSRNSKLNQITTA